MMLEKATLSKIPVGVRNYGFAVLSVAVALGLRFVLARYNINGAEFPSFVLAVAITAWYAGR